MPLRTTAFSTVLFLAALLVFSAAAQAQNYQYAYPTAANSQPNYPAPQTYQYHYPAATTSNLPQYPAANSYPTASAYPTAAAPTTAYRPAAYQAPANYAPAPQYGRVQASPAFEGETGMGNLPSYRYDANLDPRLQPVYRPPQPANPSSVSYSRHPYLGLETWSGIDLGAAIAYYNYKEPGNGANPTVKSDGAWFGFDGNGTFAFGRGFFLEGDIRYALGSLDYSGSGTSTGEDTDLWEVRALFGRDFLYETFSMSPYIGVGYRTLYNDGRGTTSTGASGYRRYNELYYLPIGIHPRTHIDSNARLSSTFEFDFLLRGLQDLRLSDAGLGDPDVSNQQHSGYGLRGDIMYETRTWSFGPYFSYWHVDDSTINWITDNGSATCGGSPPCNPGFFEPDNHTIEAGIRLKYHFF